MTGGKRKSIPEGTWFAVPLRGEGFAVGIIARTDGRGIVLAYFFGPRFSRLPELGAVSELSAPDAFLVSMVGDYALRRGEWPLIGRQPDWLRDLWPVPPFARYEELSGRWFLVEFDDSDPAIVVSERQIAPEMGHRLPRSGLMGSGYAEQYLTARLSPD
jgi:hypothetical protein